MGLAMGPDGSLYVSDSRKGKIWRIMFKGKKDGFGPEQLEAMEQRKQLSHIKNPDPIDDNLEKGELTEGAKLYNTYCAGCHQRDGMGAIGRFPPIASTDWVSGDKNRLIDIVVNGLEGNITVNGENYNNVMPPHHFMKNDELATLLTYIRQNYGNSASPVTAQEVEKVRGKTNP
jgi:mono/diheme cytochrome c family protein